MTWVRWLIGSVVLLGVLVAGAAVSDWSDQHPNDRWLHTSQINESADWNGSVVHFDNLTSAQQRAFQNTVHASDGNRKIPDDVSAEVWIETDAVRYKGQLYRASVAVA
jgi:hypothetical protein